MNPVKDTISSPLITSLKTKELKWDTALYDDKYDFVFKYGEDLVTVLNPQPGERILDLGCGTGYLTHFISQSGAEVSGIDNSAEMIIKAKKKYPDLQFRVVSAAEFSFDNPFDAIFSNAALHWVLEKEKAIDCMYRNLRQGGRLVLEMGGKKNVEKITTALQNTLLKYGYQDNARTEVWYFPSLSEYTTLLEKRGFRVTFAAHFNRETELKDTDNGIRDWIKMFGRSYFKDMKEEIIDRITEEVQDLVKPINYRNNKWFADYKRLRIVAIKQKNY